MSDRRVIAHLDLDAFYASVELLRDPALRGKPVIVSGSGPRAVVTTATYEARAFGVGSAMPTSQARRLCPQAILIAPDFPAYRAASREVWSIVRGEVDRVEQVGIDEGYLDLTGLVTPKAAMRALVGQIRRRTGLGASVGIAPNKLIAKLASDCDKPGGLVALSLPMARERFGGAPASLLPGVGPKTAERLAGLGVDTIAALAAIPPERLQAAFGTRHGADLARRGRLEDASPVEPVRATKSQSSETTFDDDVADHDEQERVVRRLAEQLCRRLADRGLRGRTIGIKVRLDDWTTVTRARTVAEPTAAADVVTPIAVELLRAYAPPRPVRLLGVRVAGFDDAPAGAAPDPAAAGQLRLGV